MEMDKLPSMVITFAIIEIVFFSLAMLIRNALGNRIPTEQLLDGGPWWSVGFFRVLTAVHILALLIQWALQTLTTALFPQRHLQFSLLTLHVVNFFAIVGIYSVNQLQ